MNLIKIFSILFLASLSMNVSAQSGKIIITKIDKNDGFLEKAPNYNCITAPSLSSITLENYYAETLTSLIMNVYVSVGGVFQLSTSTSFSSIPFKGSVAVNFSMPANIDLKDNVRVNVITTDGVKETSGTIVFNQKICKNDD